MSETRRGLTSSRLHRAGPLWQILFVCSFTKVQLPNAISATAMSLVGYVGAVSDSGWQDSIAQTKMGLPSRGSPMFRSTADRVEMTAALSRRSVMAEKYRAWSCLFVLPFSSCLCNQPCLMNLGAAEACSNVTESKAPRRTFMTRAGRKQRIQSPGLFSLTLG